MTDTRAVADCRADARSGVVDPRRWLALSALLLGTALILIDVTIVNVAVPAIGRELAAGPSAIEWVLSGYALAFALVLVPGGRLGDRFGRRRMFLLGVAGFTVASALCGLATGVGGLVAWRVVQGLFAGLLFPQITAVIQVAFPPGERGRAFAAFGAVAGASTALGPLLGGVLIAIDPAGWGWRLVFLVNVPIGLLALTGTMVLLHESYGRGGFLDPLGVALLGSGVCLLVFPLLEGRAAGWPLWAYLCLAASVPVLALFVGWERRVRRRGLAPLVDLALFRRGGFAAGVALTVVYFAALTALFFTLSLTLQAGLGYTAFDAGLTVMPWAIGTLAGSIVSAAVTRRLGRAVLQLGAALVAAGLVGLILTMLHIGPGLAGWQLLPALLVGGIGSGLIVAPSAEIVLAAVPGPDAGAAGGVRAAGQQIGAALGVAVLGLVFFGSVESPNAGKGPDPETIGSSFIQAMAGATWWIVGAAAITFLLVFLLPRSKSSRHEPERSLAPSRR